MATAYRLAEREEIRGQGVRAFRKNNAEREERDHPIPRWSPWLRHGLPVPCGLCQVQDRGRDWTQFRDSRGQTYTVHVDCARRALYKEKN